MGNFYVNVTLKGPGRHQIAAWLSESGCEAYLSPTVGGVTTVCEAVCDSQDDDHIRAFAAKISERLGCVVLAVARGLSGNPPLLPPRYAPMAPPSFA